VVGTHRTAKDWMTNEIGASMARVGNEHLRAYDSSRPAMQIGPLDQCWSQWHTDNEGWMSSPRGGQAEGGTQERMQPTPMAQRQPHSIPNCSTPQVKIRQQNVNKSLTAQSNLLHWLDPTEYYMATIQEPYLNHNHNA